jgi:hypothetical protein
MEARLMKACCDYCRGKLGLIVHRYWQMRFCSSSCTQRYEQRRDEMKSKMRRLDSSAENDALAVDSGGELAAGRYLVLREHGGSDP